MPYADYTYYSSTYGGKMTEADYNCLSRKASAYINRITFNRAKRFAGEEVKDACCAVADELFKQEQGGEVASESVGSWSRSYKVSDTNYAQKLYDAAAMYLSLTGLLYRG